jgi:hypothetical protein
MNRQKSLRVGAGDAGREPVAPPRGTSFSGGNLRRAAPWGFVTVVVNFATASVMVVVCGMKAIPESNPTWRVGPGGGSDGLI